MSVSATVHCPGLLTREPRHRSGPANAADSTEFNTQAWPSNTSTVVSLTTDNATLLSASALTCPDLAFALYDEDALSMGLTHEPACGPTTGGTAVRVRGPGLLDLGDLRCGFWSVHNEGSRATFIVQGVLIAGEVVCMAPSATQPTNVRLAAPPRCPTMLSVTLCRASL